MTKKKPDSDKPKAASKKDSDSKPQHIVLDKEDWEEVMKELRNPSPPTEALKELLRRKRR